MPARATRAYIELLRSTELAGDAYLAEAGTMLTLGVAFAHTGEWAVDASTLVLLAPAPSEVRGARWRAARAASSCSPSTGRLATRTACPRRGSGSRPARARSATSHESGVSLVEFGDGATHPDVPAAGISSLGCLAACGSVVDRPGVSRTSPPPPRGPGDHRPGRFGQGLRAPRRSPGAGGRGRR